MVAGPGLTRSPTPAGRAAATALGEAGLVDARRTGREVRYQATPQPLADAVEWMLSTGAQSDRSLARLKSRVEGRA